MNYTEVLEYLLQSLPMFQRIGAAAYKANLDNINKLCDVIGNPQHNLKCIHIAGTNGKGSVTHIISAVLQQQGYKVGTFTSPHYKDFRERIKINGVFINEDFICKFVNKYHSQFSHIEASFFEITTAMMFAYFKEKQTDYCVIETGMGGRLDSTNVINPLLSVITNISYDHMQFLGNTLPKIAAEKAGIIKANTPVIIGETQKETEEVFLSKAALMNAPISFADHHYTLSNFTSNIHGCTFDVVNDNEVLFANVYSDVAGSYQKKNITTALAALIELKSLGINLDREAFLEGLANVKKLSYFIGRWMVLQTYPVIIADSAHNEGGLNNIIKDLPAHNNLHIVFGTVADKDLSKVFSILPRDAKYYFCKPNIPRGKNATTLAEEASAFLLSGNTYDTVNEAFNAAKANQKEDDLVLVCGSIFVVAEII